MIALVKRFRGTAVATDAFQLERIVFCKMIGRVK